MTLLVIKNVSKTYGEKKVIQNVSFTINKGEILAILGESGSGKTTLLQLIAALKEPSEGVLLLEDERITPPSEKLIAGHPHIKLVRQDYGLFPNMSIRENIAYELRYYEENYRNKRIDNLLKISKLSTVQHQLPREVSGGEQQRAVIIKAIAEVPKLLLLDEPFSHLDKRNKRILKDFILTLVKEEQMTCLFVTHEVSDAFAIADQLVVMRKGKFLQMGNPQQVYQQPHTQYIAEITGEVNLIPSKIFSELYPTFSETTAHKTILVRPENLKISEQVDFYGTVEQCQFLGTHFEVNIKVAKNNFSLQLLCEERLSINQSIGIKILDYWLIH